MIAALVAVALALLFSLLLSRRLTGPLKELADAAEDVAAGNLDVRVAPRADDEVGALAVAFDAMADRLARDEQWRRDMTADLSHELRAPLAAIQSRLALLEDGSVPATAESLRAIDAEVEQLDHLLGALHSLNELESEDLSVEYEGLDLSDVARAARDAVAGAFAAKGVALSDDLQTVMVRADRERLLQATADLLDNALKFTPMGGRVVLAVSASGGPPGVAPEAAAHSGPSPAGPDRAASAAVFPAGKHGSPSPIPAPASTLSICPSSSTASTAHTRLAIRRAWGSASPSPAVLWRLRAAPSRLPTARAAVPCSLWSCRRCRRARRSAGVVRWGRRGGSPAAPALSLQ